MQAILTYHSIDSSGSPISCHPDAFEEHLAWLGSGRVRVTTLEDLLTLPASVDAVALTFDDGFANFKEVAAPRLRARGFPATVFVVTDRTGSTNQWQGRAAPGIPTLPLLDWKSLARLTEQGFSIGAHTRTHPDLTGLPQAILEDETLGSIEAIQRRTGIRPRTFAYPYGRVDPRSAAIVSAAFVCGCTTEFRALGPDARPARLPRLDMYYFQGRGRLEAWGTAAFGARVALRRAARRVRQLVAAAGGGST